jgi:hypothetical protein
MGTVALHAAAEHGFLELGGELGIGRALPV